MFENVKQLIFTYRYPILILLIGLVVASFGILAFRSQLLDFGSPKVEVLSTSDSDDNSKEIVVEVAGAVGKPGVYKFRQGARIGEAITAAGGISDSADFEFFEKTINQAAYLTDGQKIYILKQSEVSSANSNLGNQTISSTFGDRGSGLVNINAGSQSQLEELPGIGPVYAKNIIEQRPYSTVDELLTKGVLKQGVYQKIKDLVTAY